jgi:DNA-binding NtrC family response regulator
MNCLFIVDPGKSNIVSLAGFLSEKDIAFETISDPMAGIQRAQEQHFDVFVLDADLKRIRIECAIRILKGCNPFARIIVQADSNSRRLEAKIRKEQIYYYHLNSFGVKELALAVFTALGLHL